VSELLAAAKNWKEEIDKLNAETDERLRKILEEKK